MGVQVVMIVMVVVGYMVVQETLEIMQRTSGLGTVLRHGRWRVFLSRTGRGGRLGRASRRSRRGMGDCLEERDRTSAETTEARRLCGCCRHAPGLRVMVVSGSGERNEDRLCLRRLLVVGAVAHSQTMDWDVHCRRGRRGVASALRPASFSSSSCE